MKSLLLFLISMAGVAQASSIYLVQNLGGFGGSSTGWAISSNGVAAGWSVTASGDTHAMTAAPGESPTDLAPAGSSDSYAYGINAAGTTVGVAYLDGQAHGIIQTGATTVDLGAGTYAMAINASGQVAGGNGEAFIYSNGGMENLGALAGGTWSSAYAINDSGSVAGVSSVGNSEFGAFVWNAATGMQALPGLGGSNSDAMAINDSGIVAGYAMTASGYDQAVEWSGTSVIDLGTLGGASSFAYGINDQGVVVGYSWLASGSNPHAFAYFDGVMIDLNTLIPVDSGWELLEAFGINNAGQIVGTGLYDGQQAAFLLDPNGNITATDCPEPASLLLFSLGLFGFCAWRPVMLRSWRNKPKW